MTRIYNCFHDHGCLPYLKCSDNIRAALLCGAALIDRGTGDITDVLRDNTGDNISSENKEYSELTGYYWVWKNVKDIDVVGIEHYRRYFIKPFREIKDTICQDDLFDEGDIKNELAYSDFIVPIHESLANTSVYDLYVICFHDTATEMVKCMRNYFIEKKYDNYLQALYEYMARNRLFRGNMLITKKDEFDNYCSIMFDMIDYLKEHMIVEDRSRIWGYVTEVFPMIYITANNKTFNEINIAVDDSNYFEGIKKIHTTYDNKEEIFNKSVLKQIEFFKSL